MLRNLTRDRKLPFSSFLVILLTLFLSLPARAKEAVPTPWNGIDIGKPDTAGASKADNGMFTVTGSGVIGGPSDQFHFVYQSITGDFAVTARVTSVTGDSAQVGLVAREALAGSANSAALVLATGHGVRYQVRNPGDSGAAAEIANVPVPAWLKLVKRGGIIDGYFAPDRNGAPGAWKQLGGDQPLGTGLVYVGFGVGSGKQRASSSAVFDHVSLGPGGQALIENGTYPVSPVSAPALALEAAGAADGAAVDIGTPKGAANQKWTFVGKGNGLYAIHPSDAPTLALTVTGGKAENGTRVILSTDRGDPSQLWSVVRNTNGSYSLLPQSSPGTGLDDFGGNAKPGALQDIWLYNSNDLHLQWTIGDSQQPASGPMQYQVGPDSQPQPGTPKGETFQFELTGVKYYPGTKSTIWVYVPAEYTPEKPACLCVGLDGPGNLVQTVFDNLIYKKQMPVTIGVFVSPGAVSKAGTDQPVRFDRCYEFDSVNDNFDRFLMEEVLPAVEEHKAGDGRAIHLSTDPNDHMIYGGSSGGVAAFTAAWQRPDLFRRVFTAIGTYVGMRGADMYPTLVRKTEPKPIRIFLQDGAQDTWNPLFDNWWTQNRSMEESLSFAGYDVNHSWGTLGHEGSHATSIFPDVVKWLWRDYPQPITPGSSGNSMLGTVLVPGQTWAPVATTARAPAALRANPQGQVFFHDGTTGEFSRIDNDGTVRPFQGAPTAMTAAAFGPDGLLVEATLEGQIVIYDPAGKAASLVLGISASTILVANDGSIYAAGPSQRDQDPSLIWLIKPDGTRRVVDSGLRQPTGLAFSPDHNMLFAAEGSTHWVYSYVIQPDGSLQFKQRFYWLHTAENTDNTGDGSGATDMAADVQGNLYVATRMGVQVCDRNGRVEGILTLPQGAVTSLCFGGKNFDTLYIVCGGRIFQRRMKVAGVAGWSRPIPLPPAGAG